MRPDGSNVEALREKGLTIEERTPEDILKQALRYRPYWKDGGGITVSGGEALLQIDFVTELFSLAKAEGVTEALKAQDQLLWVQKMNSIRDRADEKFLKLCEVTDLFMLDIKHIDDSSHKSLTGWTNKNILDMASFLSDNGKEMWIRHVLVPGITTDEEEQKSLSHFIDNLKTVSRVEVLPYHKMGIPEYERLGIEYPLVGVEPPSRQELESAKEILEFGN